MCIKHPWKWLQVVLKAAVMGNNLTSLTQTHPPPLIILWKDTILSWGQIPNGEWEPSFLVYCLVFPRKTISFFAAEWARSLLPSLHFDALCLSGCLIVTQVMDWTMVWTWMRKNNVNFFIFFLLGEGRRRKTWLKTLSRNKKLNLKLIDNKLNAPSIHQPSIASRKFTMLDHTAVTFQTRPHPGGWCWIIRTTDTHLPPFVSAHHRPSIITEKG